MSNKDWASGMQPLYAKGGGSPRTLRYPLYGSTSVALTTAIYKGQPVLWNNTYAHLKPAAVTTLATCVVGVAAEYRPAASTATDLAVWEGKDHVFVIQSDGTTTTSKLSDVQHKNFAPTGVTAGSTITGLSGMELDFSSGTSADKPIRVLGLTGEIGESAGANMKLVCEFNFGWLWNDTSVNP